MNLNTAIFEGNLADAPQLNHTTGSQIPVTEAVVLVNRRVQDDTDQWVNAEPTRHRIKAWRSHAEHLANLPKGTTVLVVGTTTTETWPDKETGQKRTSDIVIVDAIGASLRFTNVYPEPATGSRQATRPTTRTGSEMAAVTMAQLLTRSEAAKHLQISVDELDELRRSGRGPEWGQWQGTIRYAVAELNTWAEAKPRRIDQLFDHTATTDH